VLVGTEESLTPNELSYLMIARWFRNLDPATARAKMALLVKQGMARYTGVGRTMAVEAGLEKLEEMARPPERDRYQTGSEGPGNRREPRGHDQDSPEHREPQRSSFGDYGAPRGPKRNERDRRS